MVIDLASLHYLLSFSSKHDQKTRSTTHTSTTPLTPIQPIFQHCATSIKWLCMAIVTTFTTKTSSGSHCVIYTSLQRPRIMMCRMPSRAWLHRVRLHTHNKSSLQLHQNQGPSMWIDTQQWTDHTSDTAADTQTHRTSKDHHTEWDPVRHATNTKSC